MHIRKHEHLRQEGIIWSRSRCALPVLSAADASSLVWCPHPRDRYWLAQPHVQLTMCSQNQQGHNSNRNSHILKCYFDSNTDIAMGTSEQFEVYTQCKYGRESIAGCSHKRDRGVVWQLSQHAIPTSNMKSKARVSIGDKSLQNCMAFRPVGELQNNIVSCIWKIREIWTIVRYLDNMMVVGSCFTPGWCQSNSPCNQHTTNSFHWLRQLKSWQSYQLLA